MTRIVLAVAVPMLALPSAVLADPGDWYVKELRDRCTPGSVRACASARVEAWLDGTRTNLRLWVRDFRPGKARWIAIDFAEVDRRQARRTERGPADGDREGGAGPNACGDRVGDDLRDACAAGAVEVVPEPLTIVLLGSGLAAVGGLGLGRRRRRHELVDD